MKFLVNVVMLHKFEVEAKTSEEAKLLVEIGHEQAISTSVLDRCSVLLLECKTCGGLSGGFAGAHPWKRVCSCKPKTADDGIW